MRIRQTPHIDGNFSTLVYIELSRENADAIIPIVPIGCDALASRTGIDVTPITTIHMSLSKHQYLKPHMIEPFLDKLTRALSTEKSTLYYLSSSLRFYLNENRNTAFIGLPVDLGVSPRVLSLIDAVSAVFQSFDLEGYYADANPHISLASCANLAGFDWPTQTVEGPKLDLDEDELADLRIDVSHVCVEIGNSLHRIPLA